MSQAPSRLAGLDSLRMIAIVTVMLFHSGLLRLKLPMAGWFSFGWMGVDLFFLLSGYLIGGQLFESWQAGRFSAGRFYARRLMRTLPAYILIVAVYFLLPSLRENPEIQPFWQFASFTENLFIDITHSKAFSHVWSLCVEEQFYLFMPLIALLALRLRSLKVGVGLILGVILLGVWIRYHQWATVVMPVLGDDELKWPRYFEAIYYPTWCRMDELVLGVALAAMRVFRRQWWEASGRFANVMLLAGLGLLWLACRMFDDRFTLVSSALGYPVVAMSMALIVFAGAHRSLLSRWRIPGAGLMAAMAYSLYLSHKLVMAAYRETFSARFADQPVIGWAICAAMVLLGGYALYRIAERPSLYWRERLLGWLDRGQAVKLPEANPVQSGA
ncbi:acyltransferase [Burkholderiaceae bacterium DAT-1]|nr:acyltransferase [Burkholderiaceae bacterium DAT-1]